MAIAAHTIELTTNGTTQWTGTTYGTGSAGTAVAGAKDVTFNIAGDILDTTDFADGAFRTKITGLRDGTVSFSGQYEAGVGTGSVKDTFDRLISGEAVYYFVGFQATGTHGVFMVGKIESLEITGAVDGLIEMSVSIQLDATQIPCNGGTANQSVEWAT